MTTQNSTKVISDLEYDLALRWEAPRCTVGQRRDERRVSRSPLSERFA